MPQAIHGSGRHDVAQADRQPDQQEDDRGQQERRELPDGVERLERPLAHADPPGVVPDEQPRDDRGDDPGLAEPIGDDVGPVCRRHRQRQLHEVVVDRGDQPRRHPAAGEPDRRAGDDDRDDRDDDAARGHAADDDLDRDREHDERRPVVEEALALDERREAPRRAELLERRDDSDRIGRRDHRADYEAQLEREPGRDREDRAHDRRADENARRGEQDDPAERPPEVVDVDPERGLEHEARQQHEQDDLGADLDVDREHDAGDDAEHDQRDGVRDREREAVDDPADEPGRRHEADEQLDRQGRRLGRHQDLILRCRGPAARPDSPRQVRSWPSPPRSRRKRSISEIRSSPDGSRSSSTIASRRST